LPGAQPVPARAMGQSMGEVAEGGDKSMMGKIGSG
jgi:hypothetical protein